MLDRSSGSGHFACLPTYPPSHPDLAGQWLNSDSWYRNCFFRTQFAYYFSLFLWAFVPFTAAGQRENHPGKDSLLFPDFQPVDNEKQLSEKPPFVKIFIL
jgi:hypothetical protein